MSSILNIRPRVFYATLCLGSLAAVAATVWMTQALQLRPCPLCIFQRVLLLGVALWALLGWVFKLDKPVALLIALTSLGGVATAGWQTWLQLHPEASTCLIGKPDLIERIVDFLGGLAPQLFLANGTCTSKEWTWLGLSLANWALVAFVVLTALALWRLLARQRPRRYFDSTL